MSWLLKPGESLFDSCRDRYRPEDVAKVDDPSLSEDEKWDAESELMEKYGLELAMDTQDTIDLARGAGTEFWEAAWNARRARQRAAIAELDVKIKEEELIRARAEAARLRLETQALAEKVQPAEKRFNVSRLKAEKTFTNYYCQAKRHSIISLEGEFEKAFSGPVFNPVCPSSDREDSQPNSPTVPARSQVESPPAARPSASTRPQRHVVAAPLAPLMYRSQATAQARNLNPPSQRIGGVVVKRERSPDIVAITPEEHKRSKRRCMKIEAVFEAFAGDQHQDGLRNI